MVSKSAVERIICCFADPGDTTVNPPPLKSFWGLVPDKTDCPARIGEPKTIEFIYHTRIPQEKFLPTEEFLRVTK